MVGMSSITHILYLDTRDEHQAQRKWCIAAEACSVYVTHTKDTSCTTAAIRATCTTPGGYVVCQGTKYAPIHDILEVVF